jgi:hypothetical protein
LCAAFSVFSLGSRHGPSIMTPRRGLRQSAQSMRLSARTRRFFAASASRASIPRGFLWPRAWHAHCTDPLRWTSVGGYGVVCQARRSAWTLLRARESAADIPDLHNQPSVLAMTLGPTPGRATDVLRHCAPSGRPA